MICSQNYTRTLSKYNSYYIIMICNWNYMMPETCFHARDAIKTFDAVKDIASHKSGKYPEYLL